MDAWAVIQGQSKKTGGIEKLGLSAIIALSEEMELAPISERRRLCLFDIIALSEPRTMRDERTRLCHRT